MSRDDREGLSGSAILTLVIVVVVALVMVVGCFEMWENLEADQIMVIQSPISGELTFHATPGMKTQSFGTVTKYPKRSQFWFTTKTDQGKKEDESLKVRFNDGGHATISGSISVDMPVDPEHLTLLHTKFGSWHAIEQQMVRTLMEKSVYMTGPLMSSTESYASKRGELLSYIEDQVVNGVYRTESIDEKTKDPMTGQEKTVKVVRLVKDQKGNVERETDSPIKEFGLRVFNLSINEIKYEGDVENQIKSQQASVMQVQTSIARAKQAEQDAITAKKQGEADAAKAEWAQKAIAAKEVALAEQNKKVAETNAEREKNIQVIAGEQRVKVAELDLTAAKLKKDAEIAIGEGESKRRQLVMDADGALERKLSAWVEVNRAFAEQIGKYQGNWVPTVVMGGGTQGQAAAGGATDLIQLVTAKMARDLGLDMQFMAKRSNPAVSKP